MDLRRTKEQYGVLEEEGDQLFCWNSVRDSIGPWLDRKVPEGTGDLRPSNSSWWRARASVA